MIPFIYDYHPVHQKLAKLFIKMVNDLDEKYKNNVEIWMYSSGDLLKDDKLNVYFPYSSFDLKEETWKCFRTQMNRHDYDSWNKKIDLTNAKQIDTPHLYAEKCLRVTIE